MLRKLATIIGSTIVGTILYARVKEKRSYKSFYKKNDSHVWNEKRLKMYKMQKSSRGNEIRNSG